MSIRLADVEYSEVATIAAFRDYYNFLKNLYLDETVIVEPPVGGWPAITAESLEPFQKNDDVISLLRKLPYINWGDDDQDDELYVFSGNARPADWNTISSMSVNENLRFEPKTMRLLTEGHLSEDVPDSVFGLTWGGRDTDIMLLDTKHGLIYWHQCPGEVYMNPCREMVDDDHLAMRERGDCSAKEAEWRGDSMCWAIADFLEVLKDQFRSLRWIPLKGGEEIIEVGFSNHGREAEEMLQNIFREHGWPDVDEFDKEACSKAVRSAMHRKFPDDDSWESQSESSA